MFSNPKANCCRPARFQSNEPCVPSSDYRKGKPCKNPLRTHPMNNAEILASVQAVSNDIHGPAEGCANTGYDCQMTEQKKNYGHPLYHKMYMKTSNMQSYPVHYTVPPVDYRTYLQRQKEQMCSNFGRNFEQTCYMTTGDLEKLWRTEEFVDRYRPGKPSGICPKCKSKKLRKNLPHCCSCRCAYYQKLGWQNVNPICKQGQEKCCEKMVMKSLPLKKSCQLDPPTNRPQKVPTDKKTKTKNTLKSRKDPRKRGTEDRDEMECQIEDGCDGGQTSEYRESYQYRLSKSDTTSSSSNNNTKSKGGKSDKNKPDWNKSIKLKDSEYVSTLASEEAKLEELDKMLGESPTTHPVSKSESTVTFETRRKMSKSRKEHPRDYIRKTLLKEEGACSTECDDNYDE